MIYLKSIGRDNVRILKVPVLQAKLPQSGRHHKRCQVQSSLEVTFLLNLFCSFMPLFANVAKFVYLMKSRVAFVNSKLTVVDRWAEPNISNKTGCQCRFIYWFVIGQLHLLNNQFSQSKVVAKCLKKSYHDIHLPTPPPRLHFPFFKSKTFAFSSRWRSYKTILYQILNRRTGQFLRQSCFSDFVFKIRLIRLGFFFKKLKIPVLYLNSQPTDSQSGVITITPKSQLWMWDMAKLSVAFSHAWLILVEFA